MIDQNTSPDLNQTKIPSPDSYSSNISVGEEKISSLNPEPPVGSESTVIVSSGEVPKWFYFIFGIVLIAFLAVTTFLVIILTKKQSLTPEVVPTPTVINTNLSPTIVPSPTPTTLPIDPAVLQFREQGSSDEVPEIETDIKNTDLSSINESLSALDSQMGVTSGR